MMSELNNLKNEASHVRQEKNSAQYNYIQLKQNISQQNGLNIVRNVPSYLQDRRHSPMLESSNIIIRRDDNMVVESARVSVDRINDRVKGGAAKKIYDSTRSLQTRNKGIDVVHSAWEDDDFYSRFMADIADIETINARVERDVEFRVQQRIKKFGKDGKRILGIHILVPIDKELEPFFK